MLKMSQDVVHLGVRISRFERRPVGPQQWTVAAVEVGGPQPAAVLSALPEWFVPGEYFDFDEEHQLSAPAFDTFAGGVRVGTDGASVHPGHRVVDSYETAYEPDRGRDSRAWPGTFAEEAAYRLTEAARLERWRTATTLV